MDGVTDIRRDSGLLPVDQWRDWRTPETREAPGPRYLDRAFVQQWEGSAAEMVHPPLDHHVMVMHEGGPKLVTRSGGITPMSVVVRPGSCTTIPSGSSYRWMTEGPIAFTHVYVRPDRFGELVGDAYSRNPDSVRLAERIGQFDPLVTRLIEALQPRAADPDIDAASEYLLDSLIVRIASLSNRGASFSSARLTLTAHTVRRVCDYVEANYAERITLDDMARIAGYSRYHFVRAFREAMGTPPYAYLIGVRVQNAARRLLDTSLSIADVARLTGFSTHAQFSSRFREQVGVTPAEYRRRHGQD